MSPRPTVKPASLVDLVAVVSNDDVATVAAAYRIVRAREDIPSRPLPAADVKVVLGVLGELDRQGDEAREHAYWLMDAAVTTPVTHPEHVSFNGLAQAYGLQRASQVYHSLRRARRRWREQVKGTR